MSKGPIFSVKPVRKKPFQEPRKMLVLLNLLQAVTALYKYRHTHTHAHKHAYTHLAAAPVQKHTHTQQILSTGIKHASSSEHGNTQTKLRSPSFPYT